VADFLTVMNVYCVVRTEPAKYNAVKMTFESFKYPVSYAFRKLDEVKSLELA
jgi:hypothetical protein